MYMVSQKVIKKWVDLLDERYAILNMEYSSPSDEAYYKGLIAGINLAGYEVCVEDNKTHKILSM